MQQNPEAFFLLFYFPLILTSELISRYVLLNICSKLGLLKDIERMAFPLEFFADDSYFRGGNPTKENYDTRFGSSRKGILQS